MDFEGYATPDDVYLLGLSAQAFIVLARPFDAVDASTATIRMKGHGLSVDDVISFENTTGGTLPTGITEFAAYGPLPVTSDLFRVSLTSGGPPIASWVDAGEGWAITIDPLRRLKRHILSTATEINEHLTAHLPPILVDPVTGLYPQVLVSLNARMAARQALGSLEIENAAYKVARDRLLDIEEFDKTLLKDWKEGKPIQPRPTDENNIADNAARARSGCPTDWLNSGVL